MITKIEAGKIAVNAGIPMIIANSKEDNILNRLVQGKIREPYFYLEIPILIPEKNGLVLVQK